MLHVPLVLVAATTPYNLPLMQMRAHPFPPSRMRSSALSSGGCLSSNSGESNLCSGHLSFSSME